MTLEQAITIAVHAHAGQVDKAGQPYLLHPLRIMLKLETNDERIAGVLHDVVEDTPVTIEDLEAKGLTGSALEAVRLLTKTKGADYDAYLVPIKDHAVAKAVKLRDLEDNLDCRRLPTITEQDHERLNQYLSAHRFLNE